MGHMLIEGSICRLQPPHSFNGPIPSADVEFYVSAQDFF